MRRRRRLATVPRNELTVGPVAVQHGHRSEMRPVAESGLKSWALVVAILLASAAAQAGPPYVTDDPEPVDYRHWEVYLASQDAITSGGASGTAPHVEVNYGAVPDLQLHL